MKAVLCNELGGPEKLLLGEIESPTMLKEQARDGMGELNRTETLIRAARLGVEDSNEDLGLRDVLFESFLRRAVGWSGRKARGYSWSYARALGARPRRFELVEYADRLRGLEIHSQKGK